jgi:hypothetical protein
MASGSKLSFCINLNHVNQLPKILNALADRGFSAYQCGMSGIMAEIIGAPFMTKAHSD